MEKFEQTDNNPNKEEKVIFHNDDENGTYMEAYINPQTKETFRYFIKDKDDNILQFFDLTGKEEYFDEIKKLFVKYGVELTVEKMTRVAELEKKAKLNEILNSINEDTDIEN